MATEFSISGLLPLANTISQRYVGPILQDGVLRNDPLPALLKRDCLKEYTGGLGWQESFIYDVTPTYTVGRGGATYTLADSDLQIESGCFFDIRTYVKLIVLDTGPLTAELWGPQSNFDYVETRLQSSALSLSAQIATDLYKNGTATGRTLSMNGLEEALNDGSTNSWNGSTFATYGGVTRTSANGALNPAPYFSSANVNGTLTYGILEDAWTSCVVGNEMPDVMLTTNKGYSIIKKIIQPFQRFEQDSDRSQEPDLGFKYFTFNGTKVYMSQYAPGSRTASAVDTKVGFTGSLTGETIWFLNKKYLQFYVSTHPMKAFALEPFVPSQNNDKLVAKYKADINFTVRPGAQRFMTYLYNVIN